jgi:hypothetical protein
VTLEERLLHGPERPVGLRESLHRGDGVVDRRHCEHQARAHRAAVDQHRARAAHAVLAADVRAGQPDVVAERVGQQSSGGYGDVVRDAVDLEADVVELLRHCAAFIWAIFFAAATTRAVSTRTSCAR